MKKLPLLLPCLGLLAVALGCPSNSQTPARVSGSLSYKGQAIKSGTLAFHTADGTAYAGQISPDGTYTATDLPTGDFVVTVETESINPAKGDPKGGDAKRRMGAAQQQPPSGAGPAPNAAEQYIKIPSKYANAKTSTVTVTLSAGRKVFNIDLTD